MGSQKNIITESVSTDGGDFINGDNNFILKVVFNPDYKTLKHSTAIVQTKNVLNKIQNTIAGINLKRDLSEVPIDELLINNQFIFINGVAGSGKSVYAKQLLESLSETCIICFVADQFLENSLITTLHKINIEDSIENVFNEFNDFPNKLIYIDSFEKLLEGEAEAFKELIITLRKNSTIKVILSCRDYALEPLKFNFFDAKIDKTANINVPVLNDDEIKYFVDMIPSLQQISSNENLKEILRVPKYLSLAEKLISKSNDDFSKINQVSFKKELWKNVIEGTITRDAIDKKRGKTFIDITLKRAKELSIVTNADDFDLVAINELKSDGVLFEEDGKYAPSHDIFEDWGLIKYLDKYKTENPNIINFYKNLSNEPAIRRGFRLWIESVIEESSTGIYNFIIETLNSNDIESHWKDEVIVAIIKSKFCKKYFDENKTSLLENNFELLKKFIHLLKISGKDSNQTPNNDGWDVMIEFIYNELDNLEEIHLLVLRLLLDWEYILYFGEIKDINTPKYAGKIVYHILDNHNEEISSLNYSDEKELTKDGIKLLYELAEHISVEIKSTLDILIDESSKKSYHKLSNLEQTKIVCALSFFESGTLPKYFPDELIILANQLWKTNKNHDRDSYYEIGRYFGLTERHDFKYFPESAYQTFVYKLFRHHPFKALDFTIDFTNYACEKYLNSDFLDDKDEVCEIELSYDGEKYKYFGSDYLWSINRGGQITVPDLLQSVVISLERHLYDLGKAEWKEIEQVIQLHFDKIYKKANSVMLFSVMSSITMAYPRKVGEKFIPLISKKEFFEWDRHRWLNESTGNLLLNFPPSSSLDRLCNEERKEALTWEHRQKYYRGLEGFIVVYQFNIREYNGLIQKTFDELKNTIDESDVYGKKMLTEIDIRNHKVEEVIDSDNNTVLQISPDYSLDASLNDLMIENEKHHKDIELYSSHMLWTMNIYKEKTDKDKTYLHWNMIYDYLTVTDVSEINPIDSFPKGTFSILGLSLFKEELNSQQIKFCIDNIFEIIKKLHTKKTKDRYEIESFDRSISISDSEPIFSFLPKLLGFKDELSQEQIDDLYLILFLLIRDVNRDDIDIKHLFYSFKNNVWKTDFQFAHNCFWGLIKYAELNKKYKRHYEYSDEDIVKIKKEEKEILNFIENNKDEFYITDLAYSTHSHWDLEKALNIFPTNETYYFSFDYLKKCLDSHINAYLEKEKRDRASEYHNIGNSLKETLTDFFLLTAVTTESKNLFDYFIDKGTNLKFEKRGEYDVKEYLEQITDWIFYKIDSNSDNDVMLNTFWIYWDLLFNKIKASDNFSFVRPFLFKGYWKSEADNWNVLKEKSSKYLCYLTELDKISIEALIELISGIGFQSLTPNGIRVLVKHLKLKPTTIPDINFYYGEKLIMRSFKQKIKEIKEDNLLLEDFLFFLNIMIDLGSSKAYYIRENIILYKKHN